jgi:hypothetical protein
MPPRAPLDDPHSRRVVFDTVEWHDRLERLANMRRELGFLPTPGDRAIVPGDRATSTRLVNLRV